MNFAPIFGTRQIRDILPGVRALDGTTHAGTPQRNLDSARIDATEENSDLRICISFAGSAKLTKPVLAGGLKRPSKSVERGQGAMFRQCHAHYETRWHAIEFVSNDRDRSDHRQAFLTATVTEICREIGPPSEVLSSSDLTPKTYQLEMLEQLHAARELGRMRSLLVAATGTGKTIVAAFDYQRLCLQLGCRPRLLFIAHRIEILCQALRTYRAVLSDPSFGRLLSGNHALNSPDHLFTTIESLHSNLLLERFGDTYWHTVVIDECHRIASASFEIVAQRLKPSVLLGLTATPERTDGKPIAPFFDSRPDGGPAVELRLWHALELELVSPFKYFACDDSTDFRDISWGQPHESSQLDRVLTGNYARACMIISEWRRLCPRPRQSKALAFCASVRHAQFMADQFNDAGLPAFCLTGHSTLAEREGAQAALASGDFCVIVTVDLFNEGVDIPLVDTLLLLRPTQSPVIFQQQIGRGLRLFDGKESCLILDFVGQHSVEFRFDHLLGKIFRLDRRQLIDGAENGFSRLPIGCQIHLQPRCREQILNNLRRLIRQNWRSLVSELQTYAGLKGNQNVCLVNFLHDQGLNIEDLYRPKDNCGWTALCRAAGVIVGDSGSEEVYFGRRFYALLHLNDPLQIALMSRILTTTLDDLEIDVEDALRLQMLAYQVDGTSARVGSGRAFAERLKRNVNSVGELAELAKVLDTRALPNATPVPGLEWAPLCVHGHYRINEILTAVGFLHATRRPLFKTGVLRLESRQIELMFVTLDKRKGFHDSITYHDYALSIDLFHWQSQNNAAPTTKSGARYIQSAGGTPNGWSFQLFVRLNQDGPYIVCGPAIFQTSHGERPMNIIWKLQIPLPASVFAQFTALTTHRNESEKHLRRALIEPTDAS